jgi:hypothetical protein
MADGNLRAQLAGANLSSALRANGFSAALMSRELQSELRRN